MDRGCVCCSLRSDVVNALSELQRRITARHSSYDNILLETTGLADPAPVGFTFFSNPWISANFRLDSILCLVDAQHIVQQLNAVPNQSSAVNEAVNQIAFADIIILNKTDLVSKEDLDTARELVRAINVTADLVETSLTQCTEDFEPLAWDRLMGINSFSIERALQVDPTFLDSDSEEDYVDIDALRGADDDDDDDGDGTEAIVGDKRTATPHGTSDRGAAKKKKKPRKRRRHLHDASGVGSVGITARGPLDKFRFNMFMKDLLGEKARDIFRSKGVLCIKGQEKTKFVFQGVHETICFGPAAHGWGHDEEPINQIVFIGRSLPRKDLEEGFRSCVWVPLPDGWKEHLDKKTEQPYYIHEGTGEKTWQRPSAACALVHTTEHSLEQPTELQPRQAKR